MINKLREQIDKIDDKISELYLERMHYCKQIGEEKGKTNAEVSVSSRENAILARITKNAPDNLKIYLKQLYDGIFTQSKNYQNSLICKNSKSSDLIRQTLKEQRTGFPISATVACQGVEGSYSGIASRKLFEISDITYFKSFEGVFNAVEQGLCDYGVLPIENSTAGSVLPVYDLMKKHNFYIVKSIRVKINHCLAGKNIDKKIKKVYSHEQALAQCDSFIKSLGAEPIVAENTATAAKMVSMSDEEGVAVICSEESARLYNLNIIKKDVQDFGSNYTRFICISKKLQIFKGADRISIMTALPHKVGSLFNLLSSFYTQGLNLTKLESRPISGLDFEFMFYFDFVGDVESEGVLNLLAELERESDRFVFLGSYKESL